MVVASDHTSANLQHVDYRSHCSKEKVIFTIIQFRADHFAFFVLPGKQSSHVPREW